MSGLPREFLLRATQTLAPVHYYVDPTSGSDAKASPGTQALPLQTLNELERRIAIGADHPVLVSLRSGGGGYSWPANFRTRRLNAPIIFYADDTWDAGVYTTVYTGTCAGGTGAGVIVDSVGGFAVDVHRDLSLQMLTGAAAGHRKSIRNNTATDLVPYSQFGTAPAAADTFKVFTRNVVIDTDANLPASDDTVVLCAGEARNAARGQEGSPGTFVFVGIQFTGTRIGLAAPAVFYGCELPGQLRWSTAHPAFFGCDDPAGIVRAVIPQQHLGAPSTTAWRGWGAQLTGTITLIPAGGAIAGYFGLGAGQLGTDPLGQGTIMWIGGGGARATNIAAQIAMFLGLRVDSTRVLLDGATEAIVASRRGYIDVGLVDVTGFAGEEAIEVDTGGFVLLRGSGGVFPAQGSSPDFLSVAVKYGGKVVLTDGAPSFGRASGNDYDVGNGSPKNKSDFSVAGAHISHSDGSVIVRDS